MPLLSVAMIVRNEERHLERCLKSVAPMFPEIVIVDTGSTDRTVEIASKYTKKIFHSNWQKNFSLHRNESFSHASGDWIMQIDADEEIVWQFPDKGPAAFAEFLEIVPAEADAIFIPLRDWRESLQIYTGETDMPRLFRRGKVTYRRRVHNEPMFDGRASIYRGFYLKHHGYDLDTDGKKAKAERTVPLLLESIKDDPDDHECYFYLMNAYEGWLGESEKAIEYGREYIDRQEKLGDTFNQTVYHALAGIYIRQGKFSDAKDMINQGLSKWRENVDLWYDTLRIAIAEKDPLATARASQNYIHSARQVMTNRSRRTGMFFFHIDPESLANGLLYLTLSYLENGVNELANLKGTLRICNRETNERIKKMMDGVMESLKLEDLSEKRIIVTP